MFTGYYKKTKKAFKKNSRKVPKSFGTRRKRRKNKCQYCYKQYKSFLDDEYRKNFCRMQEINIG